MRPHPIAARSIQAALLAALAVLALAPAAGAAQRLRVPAPPTAGASSAQAETARVLRYWTPERMASARPLDLVLGRGGDAGLRLARPAQGAVASFLNVRTPEVPPYSVNGRIFIKIGKDRGYCSGTAIDSPTRQLVLTAGHCVNNGGETRRTRWYRNLMFVPAYTGGKAPFGAFAARPNKIYSLRPGPSGPTSPSTSASPASSASTASATPARGSGCRAATPPMSATTASAIPSPARRRWGSAATGPPAPAAVAG